MSSVLKGNRIRLVDNRSFELPLPVKYELLKEDDRIAEYEISEDEKVTCRILTKFKENMITPIYRPLSISDIYYFFSSRVFQDKTPFTYTELSLLGLEKYNVYDIIRKTRGVTPYDTYWLRFAGDDCDYETAYNAWNDFMTQTKSAPKEPASKGKEQLTRSDPHVNEILNQHKVNIAAKFAEGIAELPESMAEVKEEPVTNNTMSAEEIEALLLKSGLADISEPDEKHTVEEPAAEKSPGGKMSQADIEAMLAAANASEPASEEAPEAVSAPVEEPAAEKSPGGKMSQADIEAMLAAANGAVEAAGESVGETPEASEKDKPAGGSGGKMSQADIEALLNGMKEDAST